MTTTATELKNRLGQYLDACRTEPVEIEKNGRKVAVLMSWEEYTHLTSLEDALWLARAEAASKEGHLSPEESLVALRSGSASEDPDVSPTAIKKRA